jgi:hypothetical protein
MYIGFFFFFVRIWVYMYNYIFYKDFQYHKTDPIRNYIFIHKYIVSQKEI